MIPLETPLREEAVLKLRAGDEIELSGLVYGARDAAHARMVESGTFPFDPRGAAVYYVGPTPAPPGRPLGSAGPTTSYRMDPYVGFLLERGVRAMIGKGRRSKGVKRLCREKKAVYLVAVGGAGAYLSKRIVAARVLAYEELGTEAVWEFTFDQFPAWVGYDAHGGDVFEPSRERRGERPS